MYRYHNLVESEVAGIFM